MLLVVVGHASLQSQRQLPPGDSLQLKGAQLKAAPSLQQALLPSQEVQLAERTELRLPAGSCGLQAGALAQAQQELGWLPAAWMSQQATGAAQGASSCCWPPRCALTAHQRHCCTHRCSASPQQMLPLPNSQECSAQQASPAGLQQLAVLLRDCGHLQVVASAQCQQPPAKQVASLSRCLPVTARWGQPCCGQWLRRNSCCTTGGDTNNSHPALQQGGHLLAEAATSTE